jgi:hypothetical protein
VGDLLRVAGAPDGPARYFLVVDQSDGWPPGTKWPLLAGLLWDEARDPTPDEAARAPLLRDTDGLDRIRRVPQGPMVNLTIAIGPSRGPRTWDNFATVIAQGIRRTDVPDHRKREGGFSVGSTSWETIGLLGSSPEWYPRVSALTKSALEATSKRARRWPWQRD